MGPLCGFQKKIKFLIVASFSAFSALCAGELKIKNNATTPVNVTVMLEEGKGAATVAFAQIIQSGIIQPGEEATMILDEKKFSDVTFSIQGVTITAPPIVPITSNKSTFSGYEGEVVFTTEDNGSALVCSMTQVNMDYSSY